MLYGDPDEFARCTRQWPGRGSSSEAPVARQLCDQLTIDTTVTGGTRVVLRRRR